MNQPVPRPTSPERWRGWPREFWDPFGEFTQLWNRMGQIFESGGQGVPEGWMPVVETEETDDAYVVRAELPGMKSDDVDIELRGNELRITGEVSEEKSGTTLRRRRARWCGRRTCRADGGVSYPTSPRRPPR